MARVKIDIPEQFLFEMETSIRLTDLNYGGHMGNEIILVLAQEARMGFFKSLGQSEMYFYDVNTIQGDAAIMYKAEGHYGDKIKIKVGVNDVSSKAFDIVFVMENLTSEKTLAIAKTGIVCYNYEEAKVENVPTEFLKAINHEE